MHFTKMNGAGNDFVILDEMDRPLGVAPEDIPALVYRLCSRHTGVGADGVILLQRPRGDADASMRFYNSDGSTGEMCGNGARCACRYVYASGRAGEVDGDLGVDLRAHLAGDRQRARDEGQLARRPHVRAGADRRHVRGHGGRHLGQGQPEVGEPVRDRHGLGRLR